MRYVLSILALCAFVSSCKTNPLNPDVFLATPKPHVELKNGKVIDAKTVAFHKRFLGETEVTADTTSFNGNEVAFYSTGMDYFANIRNAQFARKVIDGQINVYRFVRHDQSTEYNPSSSMGGAGSAFHTHNRTDYSYFIQKANTKPVYNLSYGNLVAMIPETSSAMPLLKSFRSTRRVTNCGKVVGAAFIATGAILMVAAGNRSDGGSQFTTGARVVTGGAAILLTSFFVGFSNNSKLSEAIVERNREK
jgi:hypothetical protein